MRISLEFNPNQVAEKWVSVTVLIGSILITSGLLYITHATNALGEELVTIGRVVQEENL